MGNVSSKNGEKTEFINIPMAWIFGSNPNQAKKYFQKKKPLFKESAI